MSALRRLADGVEVARTPGEDRPWRARVFVAGVLVGTTPGFLSEERAWSAGGAMLVRALGGRPRAPECAGLTLRRCGACLELRPVAEGHVLVPPPWSPLGGRPAWVCSECVLRDG